MLERLLSERFGLSSHRESRARDGYELVVDSGGVKMREVAPVDELSKTFPTDPLVESPEDKVSETINGRVRTIRSPSLGVRTITDRTMYDRRQTERVTQIIDATRMTMAELAPILAATIDDPVIDKTGLTGVY